MHIHTYTCTCTFSLTVAFLFFSAALPRPHQRLHRGVAVPLQFGRRSFRAHGRGRGERCHRGEALQPTARAAGAVLSHGKVTAPGQRQVLRVGGAPGRLPRPLPRRVAALRIDLKMCPALSGWCVRGDAPQCQATQSLKSPRTVIYKQECSFIVVVVQMTSIASIRPSVVRA